MMIKLMESVPYAPTVRASTYYDGNWLYVYRYEGADQKEVIDRMISKATAMANDGYFYNYVNPSFGAKDWCCVTICSYWATYGTGNYWKMGSPDNDYVWSPRYGGNYDKMLLNLGFKKYNFNNIGLAGLQSGDMIQSWSHMAMVKLIEEEFDLSKLPTLRRGSTGNVVKNLQILLNYWMCQSGANKPLLVDGVFGSKTEEMLKLYQKIQKLYVDGVCGPITWADILLS